MANETTDEPEASAPGDKVRNAAVAPCLLFLIGIGCLIGFGQGDHTALLFFIGGSMLLCVLTCCIIFALAYHTDAIVRATRAQNTDQSQPSGD